MLCDHRRSSGLGLGRLGFQSQLCSRRAGEPHKMRAPHGASIPGVHPLQKPLHTEGAEDFVPNKPLSDETHAQPLSEL